jgi:hypothetical protein
MINKYKNENKQWYYENLFEKWRQKDNKNDDI